MTLAKELIAASHPARPKRLHLVLFETYVEAVRASIDVSQEMIGEGLNILRQGNPLQIIGVDDVFLFHHTSNYRWSETLHAMEFVSIHDVSGRTTLRERAWMETRRRQR